MSIDDQITETHSLNELKEYLARSNKEIISILPKEKIRYAIYARKSTESDSRQMRSIDDQITECLDYAGRNNLKVDSGSDIFIDEGSAAKNTGKRTDFNSLLDKISSGEIQGLISWSPDRLSRNMKDAGKIIDMVDLELIQDLHFCTYRFENTPSGKMMLGILFATSKQYSDKLSEDVIRGNSNAASEGKYLGSGKKGYYSRELSKEFAVEPTQWQLLRTAFTKRLQGETRESIVRYLNDAGFKSRNKETDELKNIKMTTSKLDSILADPFYCGLYRYGNRIANLTEHYAFKPMLSPDEYISLNREAAEDLGGTLKVNSRKRGKLGYQLLKNKVICHFCDEPMHMQSSLIKRGKNSGSRKITFYCRNRKGSCLRYNDSEAKKRFGKVIPHSISAESIMNGLFRVLNKCTKLSSEAYNIYKSDIEDKIARESNLNHHKIRATKEDLRRNKKLHSKYLEFQLNNLEEYNKFHKGKLEEIDSTIDICKQNIEDLEEEKIKLNAPIPTKKEFYELVRHYPVILNESKDIIEIDTITDLLVTNLRAGFNDTPVVTLRSPYNLMLELPENQIWLGVRESNPH